MAKIIIDDIVTVEIKDKPDFNPWNPNGLTFSERLAQVTNAIKAALEEVSEQQKEVRQ